jgi:hypothetical protein
LSVLTQVLRALRRSGLRRDPVIHLYCLCWNEERMLPFFFRHYDPLVARYFIFDNGSTDGSLALLAAHPKVTVGAFRATRTVIMDAPAFYETVWHRSRGQADWIFIVNIDEHLHHPDGLDFFGRCQDRGITAVIANGYQMVSETFPASDDLLWRSVTRGVPSRAFGKLCAFRPDAITRLNYNAGRHGAMPEGRIKLEPKRRLKLLHYKHLGASYVVAREAELRDRISELDRIAGRGQQYFKLPEEIVQAHNDLLTAARPVPGLVASPSRCASGTTAMSAAP